MAKKKVRRENINGIFVHPEVELRASEAVHTRSHAMREMDGGGTVKLLTERFRLFCDVIEASKEANAEGQLFLLRSWYTGRGAMRAANGINGAWPGSIQRPVPPEGKRWVAVACPDPAQPNFWAVFVGLRDTA